MKTWYMAQAINVARAQEADAPPLAQAGGRSDQADHDAVLLFIGLTAKTMIFVGSDYEAPYRLYR